MKNINIRIDNTEIRRVSSISSDEQYCNDKFEIVQWMRSAGDKDFYIVLAFLERDDEGFDVRSVGSRPWDLSDEDFNNYNNIIRMFLQLDYQMFEDDFE